MRALLLVLVLLAAAPAHADCAGDCDGDGVVQVAELVGLVGCALRVRLDVAPCLSCADTDASGAIEVHELIAAVAHALGGCPASTPPCRRDADCAQSGTQCVAPDEVLCGICLDDPDECTGDGDCGGGQVCAPTRERMCPPCDGTPALICTPACARDGDCAAGERCGEDGHCVRPTCGEDLDCVAAFCVRGRCYDELGTCQLPPP